MAEQQEDGGRRRKDAAGRVVVALECVAGSSKAEEWGGGAGVVQEDDVVEAVRVGRGDSSQVAALEHEAPFKGGRAGLHKALHAAFKRGDTSVEVRVRGGRELQACVVPHHPAGGGKKQYVLRSLHDPNYLLGFVDRHESECLVLQGSFCFTTTPRIACSLLLLQLKFGAKFLLIRTKESIFFLLLLRFQPK
jgi:hypothetical protein